ncbi:hypothetical protein PAAG_02474 [Paracoccidioides lutzii Pb01]|uniref:Uncharacterized protein n=1 Tax=Paracoccidioides lutzii (strain ATCC MYA-826 / Pb01) TaxID=502779 RepID=C1GV01_PARBA|nr:hypothetical protein PAAG_02474 [Paracoccidioides lutzii Pb01]EEH40419.2 hypothetical protein PAAG_02474 [Paracoccidioides lutzii Pb01]
MSRAMMVKFMPPLLQIGSRTSMRNLWPPSKQNPLKIQIASLVRIADMQATEPNKSFISRTLHQRPTAHQTGKETYNFHVLFAEDDDAADVCWRFQIEKGEDLLDRLLAYAIGFGKHGSGDRIMMNGVVVEEEEEEEEDEDEDEDNDVDMNMEEVE